MKSSIITIEGKEFELVKMGREQAEQVIQLGKWINQYGVPALQNMSDESGNIEFSNGFDLLQDILKNLTADALIDLYVLIIGCTKAFANKYFDIATLIDAMTQLYNAQPSLAKVISRFFSSDSSENTMEEQSMTSEEPTDGPMTK